jgi:hypothetical protein
VRRLPAIVLVVALLAACGGGDDDGGGRPSDDTVVDRTQDVPADVQAFLDDIVDPASMQLHAEYHVLNKNGGGQHEVVVDSAPPDIAITVDDIAVDIDDEPTLAQYGIFSGFMAANPKAAIEATARRADAGDAEISDGCLRIPVQGAVTSTWCVDEHGFLSSVDNPSVRYELTTVVIQ